MIEDEPIPGDDTSDTSPRMDSVTSSEVKGSGTSNVDALFNLHGQMLDTAMRQTVAVAGFNATFMKTFLGMNPWFRVWQSQVEEAFDKWEMPSPAGVYYDYSKKMLDQQVQFLPPVMREWIKFQVMTNPALREMMHGDGVISVLEYIGTFLPGEGVLSKPPYNHTFLTEDSTGKVVPVDIEQIDKLFPRSNGDGTGLKAFPRIILTSSHAKGEKISDVTDITHGIQALARDSQAEIDERGVKTGRKPLEIGFVDEDITPKQTLILMACDTEKNPFLNAAALLRRLSDLRRIQDTGEVDTFEHASPGARRMAKLILRCMAQNPDDVDVNDPTPIRDLGKKIQLRARPELIAQHFQLIGYSKGGNVVSDAMRVLVDELTAKDGQGQSLIRMNGNGANEENVRNLVRNIACMSIAALEVPMAEHYKLNGVRRISFNNEFDLISNHMNFESTWADHKWKITGVKQNQGHDPKDALGTLEGKEGYVLDDRRVARRVKEAFAPLYGKAAISSISFTDERARANDSILIGTAPGTSDEIFGDKIEDITAKLNAAFAAKGVEGTVEIQTPAESNRRAFVLKGPDGWRDNPKALEALNKGFRELRKEKGTDLLIGEDIFERIIPDRAEHMARKTGQVAWKHLDIGLGAQRGAA